MAQDNSILLLDLESDECDLTYYVEHNEWLLTGTKLDIVNSSTPLVGNDEKS